MSLLGTWLFKEDTQKRQEIEEFRSIWTFELDGSAHFKMLTTIKRNNIVTSSFVEEFVGKWKDEGKGYLVELENHFSSPFTFNKVSENTIESQLGGIWRKGNSFDEIPEGDKLPNTKELTQIEITLKNIDTFFSCENGECYSENISVPFLCNADISFEIVDIQKNEDLTDFYKAIIEFLNLTQDYREEVSYYLFKEATKRPSNFELKSQVTVWENISTSVAYVRKRTKDNLIYVQLVGNCDWDEEHGVQLVFKEGKVLSRVSSQDGHLATADAYALPESQNSIIR